MKANESIVGQGLLLKMTFEIIELHQDLMEETQTQSEAQLSPQ